MRQHQLFYNFMSLGLSAHSNSWSSLKRREKKSPFAHQSLHSSHSGFAERFVCFANLHDLIDKAAWMKLRRPKIASYHRATRYLHLVKKACVNDVTALQSCRSTAWLASWHWTCHLTGVTDNPNCQHAFCASLCGGWQASRICKR